MKKLALTLMLASGLALAGCATPGNGPAPAPSGPIAQDSTITAIQQAAVSVCGFLPAVETVASIVATFTGGGAIVDLVGRVAGSICNAVKPPLGARKRAAVPMVNGVVIKGGFVR